MCYFSKAFKHTTEVIDTIVHELKNPRIDKVDLIVGTGVSGTILLMPISLQSGIRCGVIRKKNDIHCDVNRGGSHSSTVIESYEPLSKISGYVIIDDFISSGRTIKYIVQTMQELRPRAICRAAMLYESAFESRELKGLPPIIPLAEKINELAYVNNN